MHPNHRILKTSILSAVLIGLTSFASGVEFINNGNFETDPLGVDSATTTFPLWLESVGSAAIAAPSPISGNHSALIVKTGSNGDLHQDLSSSGGWYSDWVFEADFACSNPGNATTRSFQLNLYHGTTQNLSLRVVDVEPDGTGDLQLYNGTAFVTVLPNAVALSTSQTNLNVNHLKIVGHYYGTNTPNYDVSLVKPSLQTNSVVNQTFWQAGSPAANGITPLTKVRFDTANLVAGSWIALDNVTLTVANVGPTTASISSQPSPANTLVYAGFAGTLTIAAQVLGTAPLYPQWRRNSVDIPGATNSSLSLSNINALSAGTYSLFVSNAVGSAVSSNAIVVVTNAINTARMTNIWNILPGSVPYLTTSSNTERGLAFNATTTNLLLVSRYAAPAGNVVVLNPADGSLKYSLDMTSVSQDTSTTLGINMIAVADDGVVYAGGVTPNSGSASTPYQLYSWATDSANTVPQNIFSGDPGYGTSASNLRWGDNIAVRGSGMDTQILLAPGSGTNVALLTTPDGIYFVPTILSISGVPTAFARTGLAFGPGINTFWAKKGGNDLYLIEFDLSSNTGAVVNSYGTTNNVPSVLRSIGQDKSGKWLAGIASELPDNVQLFDISNLTTGPVLADQELFSTANINNNIPGGVGSVAFGSNYLFTLDQNNGIKAFLIDTNSAAPLNPFTITGTAASGGTGLVISWPTVAGHVYQIQSKNTLSDSTWVNVGSSITATGSSASVTNAFSGATQFYRIQGQ